MNLSDIQLDIMDYIRPAECKAEDFRGMWAEFEWENKVIEYYKDKGPFFLNFITVFTLYWY